MRDLHVHMEQGPYTVAWAEQFIERAMQAGMDEICLLEHSIRFLEFQPAFAEARAYSAYQKRWVDEKAKAAGSLDAFKALAQEVRSRTYPVKVSFGLEVCWFPQYAALLADLTGDGFFDYVLGAVHWVDNWTFNQRKYQWLGKDYNQIYRRYFELENELVQSGIFDILAHPDLIRCHGLYPSYDLSETYQTLCVNAKAHHVCIEMNTAHGTGVCPPFLKTAKQVGVAFTTGSDAHRPQDVGRGIREATAFIQAAG